MICVENFIAIRNTIPADVEILVAAKTRSAAEVRSLIEAGCRHIGHNYIQELEAMRNELSDCAENTSWHCIGHVQKNKINKLLPVVDVIQTVDSIELAQALNKRVERLKVKPLPILLEINSAEEEAKSGIVPAEGLNFKDTVARLTEEIASSCRSLRVEGLMTMGPFCDDPEDIRPFFKKTRVLFDELKKQHILNTEIKHVSMGMSDSYKIAIEEGSTMIRLGSLLFGPRAHA